MRERERRPLDRGWPFVLQGPDRVRKRKQARAAVRYERNLLACC